ncbi:unnamed protein product, partial [Tilletia controversa]
MTTERQDEETLKGKGLWKAVVPGAPPGAAATEAEKEAWDNKSTRAYTVISLLCDENIQAAIRTKEHELNGDDSERGEDVDEISMTAKELWAYLKEEYASSSVAAQIRIRRSLADELANPKPVMRDHIAAVSNWYMQLVETGDSVKEAFRCGELLASLPDAFQPWVAGQSNAQKWGVLRLGILEEERRLKAVEDRASKKKVETAFAVGPAPVTQTGNSSNRGSYGSQGSRERGGSWRGGGRGGYGSGFRGGYGSRFSAFQGHCHICRKHGHRAVDCRHYEKYCKWQEDSGFADEAPREHVAVARDPNASSEQDDLANFEFEICFAVGTTLAASNKIILDTARRASSRHIVTDRAKLQDYRPAAPGAGIDCANGTKMKIAGYGTMAVITSEGITMKLTDVFHCPTAIGNLVGGKLLTQAGCEIAFTNSAARVIKAEDGELVMKAEVQGGIWTVELIPLREVVALVKAQVKVDPVAVKVHNGWAHLSMPTLRAAAAAGLIPGLKKALGDIGFCEACAQGKMHHTPPHERVLSDDRAQRALELIHSDIFGPTRMKDALALGGYRFGLVIVDDFTKFVWIIPLRFKSDAIEALKTFHRNMSSHYSNLRISR